MRMRTLLIGLLVGGISGFAIQKYVLSDDIDTRRNRRVESADEDTSPVPTSKPNDEVDVDALLARIRALEGLLKQAPATDELESIFGDVKVPTTDEEIELLLAEWEKTDDLDKLLALIRALLLKGEKGYPKLTQVLLRLVVKGMAGEISEHKALEKIVPALKLAMRHEKELVGYVGYLLTAKHIPSMMRTGAMGAAMFLSVNRVRGSEKFAPMLLEVFMQGGAGMGKDQSRMLITAMGLMGQKEAVDPLLAILTDPQKARMHHSAIEALGQICDERAVGPLVKRLRESKENSWWSAEMTALAKIGTPEATAAAEEYLATVTNDDKFFNHAGNYLRERASPKVIDMVATRFRNNPGSGNMWSALRGLSKVNTLESKALLEEIAKTSTTNHVKRQAQRYLDEQKRVLEAVAGSVAAAGSED